MPVIASSIIVNQDRDKVFHLIKSMELFPRYIAGIESINIKRMSNHCIRSSWRINIDGNIVNWQEEDMFDDLNYSISFMMVEGDFKSYNGKWELVKNPQGTEIIFSVSIDWNMPGISSELSKQLESKAKLAVRWLLRELRKNISPEQVVKLESFWELKAPIVSELITYKNRERRTIIGFFDHLRNATTRDHFVIIVPGYGETKRDALTTAYFLAKNGSNVIRYDATDHIGESDGEIINCTMGKLKNDLLSTIDFVETTYGIEKVAVVASSLSKRIAIKAASEDKRISFMVGVVGVVNLQETLKAVYNEDIIEDVKRNKIKDAYDLLGFEVDKECTLNAIEDNYHDIETTRNDLKKIKCPVVFLVAEKDAWVRLDDVKFVVESDKTGTRELHVIPDAMHQLFENPKAAQVAMRQIVVSSMKYVKKKEIRLNDVIEPTMREMAQQNKVEKDRLRRLTARTENEEKDFWGKYIVDFSMLRKVPDYGIYLDDILDNMLPMKNCQTLLDAGCGVGYLGIWMLSKLSQKTRHKRHSIIRYMGIDFVESNVREAKRYHGMAMKQLCRDINNPPVEFAYGVIDLNKELPYPSNSFDRISSSLVISYVNNAEFTVKELLRVLKPQGTIVISTLKPCPDLSCIYRKFLNQATSEQDILEARKLLSSAGQIRRREGEGHYIFFSENELKMLLVATGARNVKTFRSFGDQANVVVATK